jgi:hypothetical protein
MKASANSVIWLTSPRSDEVSMVESMIDDVAAVCTSKSMPFQHYSVPSAALLLDAFAKIEQARVAASRLAMQVAAGSG